MVSQLVVWSGIRSVVCMTAQQNFSLQQLLSAWRRREDARSSGDIGALADARASLDAARNDVHTSLSSLR